METSPQSDAGISPEIAHPESAEPYKLFAALREQSSLLVAVAGAAGGGCLALAAWTAYVHAKKSPEEVELIVVSSALFLLIFVSFAFATFARKTEREKQISARDKLIDERVKQAVSAVDMAPAEQRGREAERTSADARIEAIRAEKDAALASAARRHEHEIVEIKERNAAESIDAHSQLVEARTSRDGWEKDFIRQRDSNLALNAKLEEIQRSHAEQIAGHMDREAKLEEDLEALRRLAAKDLLPPLPPPAIHPKWWRRDWVELWEAICLWSGCDPERAPRAADGTLDARPGSPAQEDALRGESPNVFKKLFDEAMSHLGEGLEGDRPGKRVRLGLFAKWAIAQGWDRITAPSALIALAESIP